MRQSQPQDSLQPIRLASEQPSTNQTSFKVSSQHDSTRSASFRRPVVLFRDTISSKLNYQHFKWAHIWGFGPFLNTALCVCLYVWTYTTVCTLYMHACVYVWICRLGVDPNEVDGQLRERTKRLVYAVVYGVGTCCDFLWAFLSRDQFCARATTFEEWTDRR